MRIELSAALSGSHRLHSSSDCLRAWSSSVCTAASLEAKIPGTLHAQLTRTTPYADGQRTWEQLQQSSCTHALGVDDLHGYLVY